MGPPSILWGWVLMATMSTGATASLVEQRPRWVLVARGQAKTLHCILRNSQYPWMSWYQQDLQGSLQVLATLRSPGDEEVVSRPGADYRVKRVDSTELRLHVTNVTQGRSLYCTCSTHSERPPPWTSEHKPSWAPTTDPTSSFSPTPMLPCCLFSTSDSSCSFPMPFWECSACLAQRFNYQFNL